MLSISLHGIRIHAPIGMYPEERIHGNDFEIDVDIYMPVNKALPWPFVDYSMIQHTVSTIFAQPGEILEAFVREIHESLAQQVPTAERVRVCIRKMNPPLPGDVRYAQVCYEA